MKPLTKQLAIESWHKLTGEIRAYTEEDVLDAIELLKQKIDDEVDNVKGIIRAHQKNEFSIEFWRGKIAGLQEADSHRYEVFDIQDEVGEK